MRNQPTQPLDLSDDDDPERENDDLGVRKIVRVLDVLEWFVPYEWLCQSDRLRNERLAYYYVGTSLVVLATILGTSGLWRPGDYFGPVLLFIATYRAFDIVRWWLDFLLDQKHWLVVSAERSLVFVTANLIEAALIGAIWLEATGAASTAGTAMFQGFTLVTQLGFPAADTVMSKTAVAATEGVALLLLVGGVTVVLGVVGAKIRPAGKWHGSRKRLRKPQHRGADRTPATREYTEWLIAGRPARA